MANMFDFSKLNVARANEELSKSRRGQCYVATEQLGYGRRGAVFLATNCDDNGLVALRFLPRCPENTASPSLGSEISTHWLLSHHPHVLGFYTILLTRKFIVVVMEYAPGGSLCSYICDLIAHSTSLKDGERAADSRRTSTTSGRTTEASTHSSGHSDSSGMISRSGRSSAAQSIPRAERQRLAVVRRLFQQLVQLLEYCQRCGVTLGEFQAEHFLVAFDGHGDNLTPSLRLSHFGFMHAEHPAEGMRVPSTHSDGPYSPLDILHWTQTHPKPHAAPPPSVAPHAHKRCSQASPSMVSGFSGDSRSSSHSRHSCGATDSSAEEMEASRRLDVFCAGAVLFFMMHGREPYPRSRDETIKSWHSHSCGSIAWPSAQAANGAVGQLIACMLSPAEERCTLEGIQQHPFFYENLPKALRDMTKIAVAEEFTAEERHDFLRDIRELVIVSKAPASH